MNELTNDLFTLEMQILFQNAKDFRKKQIKQAIKDYYPIDRANLLIRKMGESA